MRESKEPQGVVWFRLEAGEVELLVHGHSDGSWNVSEGKGRTLAAGGTPKSEPQTIVKMGRSDGVGQIEADVMKWATAHYKTTVRKKAF